MTHLEIFTPRKQSLVGGTGQGAEHKTRDGELIIVLFKTH